jgi:hypothetical protein
MTNFTKDPIKTALITVLCLFLTLFFSQNCLAEIPPKQVFELKHVSKGKDIYIIQIFSDGKVHYQGFKAVVNGDHYAQMTQEQLYDFTIYFLSLPFEATKKDEDKRGMESWRSTIDFKSTYVRVYLNDTVFYSVVLKKLDALINLRQWLCLPKNHPSYDDDQCIGGNAPVDLEELRAMYQ